MIRKLLITIALITLAACATVQPEPENRPPQGGVGGTGGCAAHQTN